MWPIISSDMGFSFRLPDRHHTPLPATDDLENPSMILIDTLW
jgi:hypothetical protein